MDLYKFISEIVGHLAWPAVILGFGFGFREHLKSILSDLSGLSGRMTRLGPAEFQSATARQQRDPDAGLNISKASHENESVGNALPLNDPELLPWESQVRQIIKEQGLKDPTVLSEWLIQALAFSSRHCDFEAIGRTIFGTQLAALKELDQSGPLAASALENLHSEHEKRVRADTSEKPLSVLTWLGFLRERKLVRLNDDGKYGVTKNGKLFLQFAASIGVTEERLY